MEQNLYIQEDYVQITNDGKRIGLGRSDVYETWTPDKGQLYRALQRQYGRCTSKVYIDLPSGAKSIGWVFVKRQQYERHSTDTYLQETWVTLHKAPPTRVIEYHYA